MTASDTDAPLSRALDWIDAGHRVALATVIGTWGGGPRPPGSMLVVAEDGRFEGSVSGGCVETAVIEEAKGVMGDGRPRLLDYGISNEQAWDVGLACGGELAVYVEPADDPALLRRIQAQRPVALVTRLTDGARALVDPKGAVTGDLAPGDAAVDAALDALRHDRGARARDDAGNDLFIRAFNTPLRMVIVGAVHVAQELAPMAARVGFDVTVVDPRSAYANAERFPGVRLTRDQPDDVLEALAPDSRTATVFLTHNPNFDDPALLVALDSDAFYIGALGSSRTHAKRLERLKNAVEDEAVLNRIHGPIGLDLGGRGAAEIAVSILAEVIATRYGKGPRA